MSTRHRFVIDLGIARISSANNVVRITRKLKFATRVRSVGNNQLHRFIVPDSGFEDVTIVKQDQVALVLQNWENNVFFEEGRAERLWDEGTSF